MSQILGDKSVVKAIRKCRYYRVMNLSFKNGIGLYACSIRKCIVFPNGNNYICGFSYKLFIVQGVHFLKKLLNEPCFTYLTKQQIFLLCFNKKHHSTRSVLRSF